MVFIDAAGLHPEPIAVFLEIGAGLVEKLCQSFRELLREDPVGPVIKTIESPLAETIEQAAALAVNPVGVQVDGSDFCRVDAR